MIESKIRKEELKKLIEKYFQFKTQGKIDNCSEETIRTWINEFLNIFGWDVKNTSEIFQEKILSEKEKDRLKIIGSTHTKPDYILKQNQRILSFLDAKDLSVNLKNDKSSAFQIRSYGWSAEIPCAFTFNFEELCIFDCRFTPNPNQNANLGRIYIPINEYIKNFDIIEKHLLKENIYSGNLKILYSETAKLKGQETLNIEFANDLAIFRKKLAQHILSNNLELISNNQLKLNYVVQVIIDRIIFIRVCEAKNIEKEELLKYFVSKGFWSKFKESSYMEFYEHYDGPLFGNNDIFRKLNIENSFFDNFIDSLYYPSPYRFDVIPIKLLADVYEQFLLKRLVINNNKVEEIFKLDYQKNHGAISTPKYIVNEICKKTMIDLDNIKTIDEILSLKILDPACGSGTFMISIFELLEKKILDLFSSLKVINNKYCYKINNSYFLTIEMKRKIVENCIFGIDVDSEAVEVAKMSLALKIIDQNGTPSIYSKIGVFGKKILQGVGENIELGNTLVETDIYEMFENLIDDDRQCLLIRPFDLYKNKFKQIFEKNNGFDYIIGNPPYVETKHFKKNVPLMHKYITKKFSTYHGKADLSIIFIERCKKLLNKNGRLGFIVQKRFFKTEYGKKLRELLSSENQISEIIDFVPNNIFQGKITYVAILLLDNRPKKEFKYYRIFSRPEIIESAFEGRSKELNFEEKQYLLNSINGEPWNFENQNLKELFDKLVKEHGTLKDFPHIKIEGGIQVLWKKIYHIHSSIVKGNTIIGKNGFGDEISIEKEACRPVIYNKNFYCYRDIKPDAYTIFPYEKSNPKKGIPFNLFYKMYPKAGEYLLRNKELIIKEVLTRKEDDWHLFTRELNHDSYSNKKIIIPMTAKDTFCAIDLKGNSYVDNANVWFLSAENISDDMLISISAIFNSTIFSNLARLNANPQSGGYIKLNRQFLYPIPFPYKELKNNKNIQKELKELSFRIEELQKKYLSSGPSEKNIYADSLSKLWNKLDFIVNKLYGVDKDKIVNNLKRTVDRVAILKED